MRTKYHYQKEIWFKQKTRPRMDYEWFGKTIYKKNRYENSKTYPADCRKIAAFDSHKSIGIERKNINKNGFLYKNIFKSNLF